MWHLQVIVGDDRAYLNHMNENADADLVPWTKETFVFLSFRATLQKQIPMINICLDVV